MGSAGEVIPLTWPQVYSAVRKGHHFGLPPFNPADFILIVGPKFTEHKTLEEWPTLQTFAVLDVQEYTGVAPQFDCVLCALTEGQM